MRLEITPQGHTKAIGSYSPGITYSLGVGDQLIFVSGQVASDSVGNVIGRGNAKRQTEVVFERIKDVLQEAGATLEDLVSVVIYVRNIEDFRPVSMVRNRVLGKSRPSSTLVEVSSLAIPEHLVEISGVAIVSACKP